MSNAARKPKMTSDEFIRWADAQHDDIRYELMNGEVVAQSSPLTRHPRVIKGLETAIDSVLPVTCESMQGKGIAIGDDSNVEPDLIVFCGEVPGDDARYEAAPIIVAEVLSPSTASYDTGDKLLAYQRIPSLEHYLIVHPVERFVLIHSAGPERDWSIVRVAKEDFALDPPDVRIPFEPIFARLRG